MTAAGRAGQLTVVALVVVGLARLLWMHGFFRGFRRGWLQRAETNRTRERTRRVGSYRARRTPMPFPIPVDPDHQDHVDHG